MYCLSNKTYTKAQRIKVYGASDRHQNNKKRIDVIAPLELTIALSPAQSPRDTLYTFHGSSSEFVSAIFLYIRALDLIFLSSVL